MRLFPRSCAVWWKRTALSASTSSVPSPGETPGRTATTTLWSSCLTTRRPNSVAVAPPMWRSGVPGLRPTCWVGPPANSIAVCTSLRPCRLLSSVREDYSMRHDPALVADVRAWLSQPHNLVELGEACCQIDQSLDPLLRRAAPLTEYRSEERRVG